MPSTRALTRLAVLAALAALLQAGNAPAARAERTHDIQPEDYFTISLLDELALSPGGGAIAYTEMRWDEEENKRNTDLWVVDTKTRETVRLTFDPASDGSPEWSPDGKWIYFTSSRTRDEGEKPPYNGKKQVWRVAPSGGEVFAVTRIKDGVDAFHLSADGKTLYYTKGTEHVDDDAWKSLRTEFKDVTYGHGVETYSELWKLDLESWRETMLVDERRVIDDFAVGPDEKRIAMITRPTEELITNEGWSTVDVYDAGTEAVTSLPDRMWRDEAPSPYGWIIEPCWSSDGQVLAFRVDFDGYSGEVFFAHFDQGAEPLLQKMVRPREVNVEGQMGWRPGTRDLCFIVNDHARAPVMCVRDIRGGKQGGDLVMTPGDRVVLGFSFSERPEPLAVIMNGMDHPRDLFLVRGSGRGARFDRITRINPQVDTWKVPQLRIAKWTSGDGTPVEGVLELPPDYRPGDGPLPLVVVLHGGPTSHEPYCFRYWIYGRTVFAAQGWAMFAPNYRGSTGYGDKFLSDLIGNKNNLDVMDILSGVDTLIARGIADPERMAVMGWSNGGYLTNCVITHDNRFKAASSGAGVFDTAMQWSIEDTPGHVINFSKGLPWQNPDKMRETSPLYNADKITTPTLIHVGEKDARVPQEHSRGLYRALKHYRKVPTELIIYPGTGHGLTLYTHRKTKLMWDVRWFNHYVLGKMDEDLE